MGVAIQRQHLNAAWLARAVEQCDKLPPPILRVLAALGEGELSFEQLRPTLDGAAALRDRLLQVANSSYYSPVNPISDVAHAAVTIGQRQLVGMTLTHHVDQILRSGAACHGHDHNGLLAHCLATAATGWGIADELGESTEIGGMIYIAGLFHDLGKVLLARRWKDLDMTRIPDDPPGLAGLEKTELSVDHVEASVLLARHWEIDERVIGFIENHHAPGDGNRGRAILHVADHLCGFYGFGFRDDLPPETPLDVDCIGVLDAHPESLVLARQHALKETARAATTIELLL